MNLEINILTKKGITHLYIFLSFSLFYHKFQKITKTGFMIVADDATENFIFSINGDNRLHRFHLISVCFYFRKTVNA